MIKKIFPGWWQVLVCMINQGVVSGTVVIAFSVIAVALQTEFEPSRAALMLCVTVQYLFSNLVRPFVGAAMDRYSMRNILLVGAACLAGGFVALSFATSMIHVYVVYGSFMAMANALMGTLSYTALLPRWFVRQRARAMGITVMGMSFGGFVFPPLLHFLIEDFGWRAALRVFSLVLIFFVMPMIVWLIVDRPSNVGLYPDGALEPPPAAETRVAATADELPTMTFLRDLNFWVLTLVIGLVLAGAAGVLSNMAPLAISKGFSGAEGAFAVSFFATGSFSSKMLYAAFGDRLKARIGLATGLFFFMVASFGLLHATDYPILLAAAFLLGLAVGTMLPLWSYLTALVFGAAHVGRVFGYSTAMTLPFMLVFPPFLGWIYDRTGAYDDSFYLYIGLALAAAVLVPRLRAGAPQAVSPATA